VLVAVSLDPFSPQSANVEIPLWEWGLPDDASVAVTDLMSGDKRARTAIQSDQRFAASEVIFKDCEAPAALIGSELAAVRATSADAAGATGWQSAAGPAVRLPAKPSAGP